LQSAAAAKTTYLNAKRQVQLPGDDLSGLKFSSVLPKPDLRGVEDKQRLAE